MEHGRLGEGRRAVQRGRLIGMVPERGTRRRSGATGRIQNRRLAGRLMTMSTTIRVSAPTRDRFAKLAKATGRPMSRLLDEAADALERRVFFDQFSSRFEALRDDANTWSEIEAERTVESGTLRDSSA